MLGFTFSASITTPGRESGITPFHIGSLTPVPYGRK